MTRTPEDAAVASIMAILREPRKSPRTRRRSTGRPQSDEVAELARALRNGDSEMTTECLDAYTADIRATAMRHYCKRRGISATISRRGSIIHATLATR